MLSSGSRPIGRLRRALVVPLAALGLVLLDGGVAHAALLRVTYDAGGTTRVATTGSTIALGPSTLSVSLESTTGDFTGTLPLPPAPTTFAAVGLIPMSAEVIFEEAAPLTGHLAPKPDGTGSQIRATARYYLRLSNVRVAGLPTFAGPSCRTVAPVTIPMATPDDESFAVFVGGHVSGSYAIGPFANCGLDTLLVNALVPGDGNTVDLDLSNPRRTS
ncbi:hypothetical protein GCM10022237_21570 [Nocardioides ginsengisoli]|uniref:Secreted protein n=1 Tax=Nocardioides ginsengisoli TaxID=363868 RepID=A0ABW3W0Y8_9ACTN